MTVREIYRRVNPIYRPYDCASCGERSYHQIGYTPNYCVMCGSSEVSKA